MSFRHGKSVPKSYGIDEFTNRAAKASVAVAGAGEIVAIGTVSKSVVVESVTALMTC